VDADGAAASGTGPSFFFVGDELPDSMLLDVSEVLDHAHPVFRPVSFIQRLHSGAGVFFTLVAEFPVVFAQFVAVLDYTFYATRGFVFVAFPAAGAFVLFPQIGHADSAVHPARGDQFVCDVRLISHLNLTRWSKIKVKENHGLTRINADICAVGAN
jgi:hypothetical protein